MKNNVMKKIMAGCLASMMTLTMCLSSVSADPLVRTGDEDTPATMEVTKNLLMAEGVTAPAETFTFEFSSATADAPTISDQTITYAAGASATPVSGLQTLSQDTNDFLGSLTWAHAGEYVYMVTEKAGTTAGMEYSQAVYQMTVYVANGAAVGDVYVKNVVLKRTNDDAGTAVADVSQKVDKLEFNNTFRKNTSLVIDKTVTGDMGDKTKDFSFSLTLTKAATDAAEVTYNAKITRANASVENVTVTTGTAYSFTLKHGEKLEFTDLHAGTRYEVTETAVSGYTTTIDIVENGTTKTVSGVASNSTLAGENANSSAFTNNLPDTTPTGIIVNNLPFIMMIAVAVLALVGFVVGKRRKMNV